MKNGPCLNCTDRKLGCHSSCKQYKEFQKRCEEIRAKERAEKDIYAGYRDYKEEKFKRLK